jgi:UDP-N-acetylglucosamine:LPS N-acetylglucosamine transferase
MALDMITEPMPQEEGTAKMLIEAGLARAVCEPNDIVKIVEEINIEPDRLQKPLPSLHNLDQVDAVYKIAEEILSYVSPTKLLAKT